MDLARFLRRFTVDNTFLDEEFSEVNTKRRKWKKQIMEDLLQMGAMLGGVQGSSGSSDGGTRRLLIRIASMISDDPLFKAVAMPKEEADEPRHAFGDTQFIMQHFKREAFGDQHDKELYCRAQAEFASARAAGRPSLQAFCLALVIYRIYETKSLFDNVNDIGQLCCALAHQLMTRTGVFDPNGERLVVVPSSQLFKVQRECDAPAAKHGHGNDETVAVKEEDGAAPLGDAPLVKRADSNAYMKVLQQLAASRDNELRLLESNHQLQTKSLILQYRARLAAKGVLSAVIDECVPDPDALDWDWDALLQELQLDNIT